MYELMDPHAQLSRLALHAQNNYSVMYYLGVVICSLVQSKGGRPIEWMTTATKNDKQEIVLQLHEARNHLAN